MPPPDQPLPSSPKPRKTERLELLNRILVILKRRNDEIGDIISKEMGAPVCMARSQQAGIGLSHFAETIKAMEAFEFDYMQGTTQIVHEPVGVVGMITPWNWPINQIACKVAPALATGCTMVLKPSEIAPLNAILFAEILHEAGVPKGVFNLVNGDGPTVGTVLASHPDIDMVSFTGSTRAGISVAQAAAPTVKRVHQELGGKSPNIVLRKRRYGDCRQCRRASMRRQFRPVLQCPYPFAGADGTDGRGHWHRPQDCRCHHRRRALPIPLPISARWSTSRNSKRYRN